MTQSERTIQMLDGQHTLGHIYFVHHISRYDAQKNEKQIMLSNKKEEGQRQ